MDEDKEDDIIQKFDETKKNIILLKIIKNKMKKIILFKICFLI